MKNMSHFSTPPIILSYLQTFKIILNFLYNKSVHYKLRMLLLDKFSVPPRHSSKIYFLYAVFISNVIFTAPNSLY